MNKQNDQEGGEEGQEGMNPDELNDSQVQAMHEEAKMAEGEEGVEVIEADENPIDAEYQQ